MPDRVDRCVSVLCTSSQYGLSETRLSHSYFDPRFAQCFERSSGADLANLIEAADASIFQCDDGASDDARVEAVTLFDNLRDWGDLWSELSYSDKLKAQESFSAALSSLSKHSLRGYQARRVGRLVGGAPAGRAPIPFTVVYFALVPDDQELTYLLVPKRA